MLKVNTNKKLEDLKKTNEKVAALFARCGIKRFYLTGAGNSLMSGYSILHKNQPLFKRNESLKAVFKKQDIEVLSIHYSRNQNNNDEHINDYFRNNITEKEIYRFNRVDMLKPETANNGMNDELMEEYYPKNPKPNHGFRDVVLDNADDLANILVYIGATGSFLDNITRGGFPKIVSGFKRDYTSIESTLKDIQTNNREKGTNTQVYLVGIPKYLGLPLTDLAINNNLKEIANQYANVTYVEPPKGKLIYLEGKKGIDVHLNEEEYLELNQVIMQSIYDNYLQVKATIDIDRQSNFLNKSLELQVTEFLMSNKQPDYDVLFRKLIEQYNWPEQKANKLITEYKNVKLKSFAEIARAEFNDKIWPLIDHYVEILNKEGRDSQQFLFNIKKYLLNRAPYDFYYMGKKNIKKIR